ncbi:MAG: chemotaxis protein MotA [Candidatus Poribacteria bacterium]|nr:MAG: chemotaxis protein MotA [Candidatus Poribacteria bacterium]
MDIATMIGIVLGVGAILYGITGAGVPITAFIDPPSLLIVFGGVIAALLINYPLKDILQVIRVIPLTFKSKEFDPIPVVNQLIEMADQGVRKGPAALEAMAQELPDPFIQRGVELVAASVPDDQIRYALETEMEFTAMRHEQGERVMTAFASYSPAFGMIGTLIGLVAMLRNLGAGGGNAVEGISKGMAVALITTFYGALMQNLLGLPLSGKLRVTHENEEAYKRLVIEGVLMVSQAIRESLPPKTLASRLGLYLPPARRSELAAAGGPSEAA